MLHSAQLVNTRNDRIARVMYEHLIKVQGLSPEQVIEVSSRVLGLVSEELERDRAAQSR
jgi:hypothetical protein